MTYNYVFPAPDFGPDLWQQSGPYGAGVRPDSAQGQSIRYGSIPNPATIPTWTQSQILDAPAAAAAAALVAGDDGLLIVSLVAQAASRSRATVPAAWRDEEDPLRFTPVGVMDDLPPGRVSKFLVIPLRVGPDTIPTQSFVPVGVMDDLPPGRIGKFVVIPMRQGPDFYFFSPTPPALLEDRPPQRALKYPALPPRQPPDFYFFATQPPGMLEDRPPQRVLRYPVVPQRQPPDFYFYATQPPQVIDAPWLVRTLVQTFVLRPVSSGDGLVATVVAQLTPADDPKVRSTSWRSMPPSASRDNVPPSPFVSIGAVDDLPPVRSIWRRIGALLRGDDGAPLPVVAANLTASDDPRPARVVGRPSVAPSVQQNEPLPTVLRPDDAPRPARPFTALFSAALRTRADDGAPLPVVAAQLTGDDPRPSQRPAPSPTVLRHIVRWAEIFWQVVQQSNLAYWQHRLVEGFDVAATSTPPAATDARAVKLGIIDSMTRYLGM